MIKSSYPFFIIVWLIIMYSGTACAGDCSVCLGLNMSVAASEHSERLYLRIGESPRIYFDKPKKAPRIIADGLDRKKRYIVKVYFDDKVVQSWPLEYSKYKSSMVYIWRAKGSWQMEQSHTGKCTWPPK